MEFLSNTGMAASKFSGDMAPVKLFGLIGWPPFPQSASVWSVISTTGHQPNRPVSKFSQRFVDPV